MTFTTNFKSTVPAKVLRRERRDERDAEEDKEKKKVRRRDKRCRFPLCGCRKFELRREVSHQQHKGMGGNPKGDRSVAHLMIELCYVRHQAGRIAVDRGTLRWRALTDRGSDGPVAWDVDLATLRNEPGQEWFEVARETAVQELGYLTTVQRELLERLATMHE